MGIWLHFMFDLLSHAVCGKRIRRSNTYIYIYGQSSKFWTHTHTHTNIHIYIYKYIYIYIQYIYIYIYIYICSEFTWLSIVMTEFFTILWIWTTCFPSSHDHITSRDLNLSVYNYIWCLEFRLNFKNSKSRKSVWIVIRSWLYFLIH